MFTVSPLRRLAEFIRFAFQGAVGTDAEIIIGKQAIDYGNIVGKLGLTPVQFQPFDLFVGTIVVRKNSVRLTRISAGQYKDEGQSADRGKQPTMLGMSAHKRIGC